MSLRWIGLAALATVGLLPTALAQPNARASNDDAAIRAGMAVWRKADANGQACGFCHSPDGIDLAAYNFDSSTIMRRASAHVSLADAYLVDGMIQAVRRKYRFVKLLDPMDDRPMQPGGKLMPGATPIERDKAFADNLARYVPALMGPPIADMRAAQRASKQISDLDCSKVPIGIPFDRLSEDGFRGNEHASIADWLPDVSPARTPEARAKIQALQDRYLADPTDATLADLDAGLLDLSRDARSAGEQLSLDKYRAMLVFQHQIRMRALGKSDPPRLDPAWKSSAAPNPMWTIGDFARVYQRAGLTMFGLPRDVLAKKSGGPSGPNQLKDMRLAWLWAGWLMDPSLMHSGQIQTTLRGDYFTTFLWDDGPYPAHNAFAITKKLVACATEGKPFELDYSVFLLRAPTSEPQDPGHLAEFRRFVCNSFRMSLYLVVDEVDKTHAIRFKAASTQQAQRILEYMAHADPARAAQDKALVDLAIARIASARELGPE